MVLQIASITNVHREPSVVSIDELELVISEKLLSDLGYIPGYSLMSPPKIYFIIIIMIFFFPVKFLSIHFNFHLPVVLAINSGDVSIQDPAFKCF